MMRQQGCWGTGWTGEGTKYLGLGAGVGKEQQGWWKEQAILAPPTPLTLLISSRSSACIQMGLWSSRGDTWSGVGGYRTAPDSLRQPGLTGLEERGLLPLHLGNHCNLNLPSTHPTFPGHFFPSLQLPLQALTTHHPQIQIPARGHGSGSLCTGSQPRHTCPASGNRKPGELGGKMGEQEIEGAKVFAWPRASTSIPLFLCESA